LTDVDHSFTLRGSCVASLRTDRHQIGMADRHHRNPHSSTPIATPAASRPFWATPPKRSLTRG